MAAETGFLIDGNFYDVPPIDTLTMDEAQTLYDYSGVTVEDFAISDDEQVDLAAKLKNPGFMRALMHIAYQRKNPKMSASRVKTLIGSAGIFEALEHLAPEEDDAEDPPALTTEHAQPSLSGSVISSESSGEPSMKSSAPQDSPPTPTGTSESGMSSISAPELSAA